MGASPTHVIVLRPYTERIRHRMVGALEKVGLTVSADDVVASKTPDDEVIAWLGRQHAPGALLIPFHAHRDRNGELVHGLGLIRRVREELPHLDDVPIFSPISNLGLAAAGLMMAQMEEGLEGVLFLHEDELDDRALVRMLREHWLAHARAS